MMNNNQQLVPPGPTEAYGPPQELLDWLMQNLKLFGGIYKICIYGRSVYVVSDPRYVDHVLRENWQNYRKGQANKRVAMLLGNGLMVSEGDLWKKQRRMIQPGFHRESVVPLLKMIVNSTDALLSRWTALAEYGQNINVTLETSQWVLEVVLRSLFGENFEKIAPKFSILSSEPARNLHFAQTFHPLRKVVLGVIIERRRCGRSEADILGMLMEARDRTTGEAMPDEQLVNEMITLVVAGHETTASTLSWMWYLLSQHPEAEAELSRELSLESPGSFDSIDGLAAFPYSRQIIEETMRLYPPGWLLTRKALKDDQIGGYFVPAGTEIYISPSLIQRNPAIWENPDSFNPGRFAPEQAAERHPMATLPFSAGPRKCVGELLARIEMQVHLMKIAPHFRFHLISGDPADLQAGVNLRCKHDLIFAPELKSLHPVYQQAV